MTQLIKQLKYDKIKINWNKSPIRMDLFLSFLTVDVKPNPDCLGSYTGWTEWRNEDIHLIIGGGKVGGVEYLDTIRYGKNLANPYNNFVNPFYLFDIMTEEGKTFFCDYYKEDIQKLVTDLEASIESLKRQTAGKEQELKELLQEIHDTTYR